jgi:hypothetical protein
MGSLFEFESSIARGTTCCRYRYGLLKCEIWLRSTGARRLSILEKIGICGDGDLRSGIRKGGGNGKTVESEVNLEEQ